MPPPVNLAISRSVVRVTNQAMSVNEYDFDTRSGGTSRQTGGCQDVDNLTLMKAMVCSESSVQNALSQVQRQVHVAKIVMNGGIVETQRAWYHKLARDSIVYLMCFGFVPVKLVKMPDDSEGIVPVVVPLSQIEWEYETDVDSLFVCPRVFYKDTGMAHNRVKRSKTNARPRIYVYCTQCHTVDLCQLGPMCCVLDSYRDLVAARSYNARCNADNLKHVTYIESRAPEALTKPTHNMDMSSVLEHTIRALPRDTSDNSEKQDTETYDVQRKRRIIEQQLLYDHAGNEQTTACVLPVDTMARNITQRIPQIDLQSYMRAFENAVYLAMGLGESQSSVSVSNSNHRGGQDEAHAAAVPPRDPTDPLSVFVVELENILGIFASAIADTDLGKKIQKAEDQVQGHTASRRLLKRKSVNASGRLQSSVQSINIQDIGVARSVKCKIRPHIANDMNTALKFYEDSIITPESFGVFLQQTTGFDFTGLPPRAVQERASADENAEKQRVATEKNAADEKFVKDTAAKEMTARETAVKKKAEEDTADKSLQMALRFYQESLITPESFGAYLKKTTGFEFTGRKPLGMDKENDEQKNNEEEQKNKDEQKKKDEELLEAQKARDQAIESEKRLRTEFEHVRNKRK